MSENKVLESDTDGYSSHSGHISHDDLKQGYLIEIIPNIDTKFLEQSLQRDHKIFIESIVSQKSPYGPTNPSLPDVLLRIKIS